MSDDANLPIQERIARAIEARADDVQWKIESARRYVGPDRVELLEDRAATFREAARIARETSPWIAVEDGLPDWWTRVIVRGRLHGGPFTHHVGTLANPADDRTASPRRDNWRDVRCEDFDEVTHWMSIPVLPQPTGGDR